ncbi:MAG TPA: site-2 protease family protein [Verrucomicrobiae bacterium]|nr:site-2 protease family protein [Verrucomicrobiae bacterium]
MPTNKGSIRLFRLAGITVYLHWAWFIAFFYLTTRPSGYSSYVWNAAEILVLFLIVLMHEFGHQLACRSVGGQTHDIVLWPLGGVAYVTPPQRPGAQLWSIAAGPLVNVVLVPVFAGLWSLAYRFQLYETHPDLYVLVHSIWMINLVLLCFNLLPVFPLDGGQILRSLLWFVFGRANSLLIASVIGFFGVAGLLGVAIFFQSIWLGLLTAYIAMNCWAGFVQAQELRRRCGAPVYNGYACPVCKTPPPQGNFWRCMKCGQKFDAIGNQLACPHCGTRYSGMACLECGAVTQFVDWMKPAGE